MQTKIYDDDKLVCIWLSNGEKNGSAIQCTLNELYSAFKAKKYTVCVFESGSRDVYEDLKQLAIQHRHDMINN